MPSPTNRPSSWLRHCSPTRVSSWPGSEGATPCASKQGYASLAATSTRPQHPSRPTCRGSSRNGARVEGGFLGAEVILEELASGPQRKRVGISAAGKRPIRDGAELYEGDRVVGIITSGGYGPTVGGPVAMGYLDTTAATSDTVLTAHQRGKTQGCTVAPLPFVAHRYVR